MRGGGGRGSKTAIEIVFIRYRLSAKRRVLSCACALVFCLFFFCFSCLRCNDFITKGCSKVSTLVVSIIWDLFLLGGVFIFGGLISLPSFARFFTFRRT